MRNELLKDYEKLLVPYVLELEKKIDNVTMVTEAIEDFYFNGDIRTYLEANVTQVSDITSFSLLPFAFGQLLPFNFDVDEISLITLSGSIKLLTCRLSEIECIVI